MLKETPPCREGTKRPRIPLVCGTKGWAPFGCFVGVTDKNKEMGNVLLSAPLLRYRTNEINIESFWCFLWKTLDLQAGYGKGAEEQGESLTLIQAGGASEGTV